VRLALGLPQATHRPARSQRRSYFIRSRIASTPAMIAHHRDAVCRTLPSRFPGLERAERRRPGETHEGRCDAEAAGGFDAVPGDRWSSASGPGARALRDRAP